MNHVQSASWAATLDVSWYTGIIGTRCTQVLKGYWACHTGTKGITVLQLLAALAATGNMATCTPPVEWVLVMTGSCAYTSHGAARAATLVQHADLLYTGVQGRR